MTVVIFDGVASDNQRFTACTGPRKDIGAGNAGSCPRRLAGWEIEKL